MRDEDVFKRALEEDEQTPLPSSTDVETRRSRQGIPTQEYSAVKPDINKDVAVGDLNSEAKGSGARKNSGKPDFSMVPLHLLAGTARVLMGGLIKYAPWNWAKGMRWSVCFSCTCRHLFDWWYLGEDLDPESGEHHLDHVLCNVLFLRHYTLSHPDGDDRPPTFADFASGVGCFKQTFDAEAYAERNGLTK